MKERAIPKRTIGHPFTVASGSIVTIAAFANVTEQTDAMGRDRRAESSRWTTTTTPVTATMKRLAMYSNKYPKDEGNQMKRTPVRVACLVPGLLFSSRLRWRPVVETQIDIKRNG